MFKKFNHNMLMLAREARGMTQVEMIEHLKLSQGNYSKMEKGLLSVSDAHLANIQKVLKYPESFFFQEGEVLPPNLTYRKRDIVAQKLINPIEAQINICRLQIQRLLSVLKTEAADLPILNIDELGSPAKAAKQLRKDWGMKEAVIKNLTQLMESKGIIIASFNFGTHRVDARSVLTEDKYPIVFLNKTLLGDRLRFSLAYELGHLVMHLQTSPALDRDVSHEANLFAAEFLMPEKEIKADLQGNITIAKLGELKKKWKVSMQALLYRADDLGLLSANQKRYLLEQFNQMNIRRREPLELDVARETPMLLKTLITKYKTKMKMDVMELASFLHMQVDEFLQFYG